MTDNFDINAFPRPTATRFVENGVAYSVWDQRHVPAGVKRAPNRSSIERCNFALGCADLYVQSDVDRRAEGGPWYVLVRDSEMSGWLNCPPWELADVEKGWAVWKGSDHLPGVRRKRITIGFSAKQALCNDLDPVAGLYAEPSAKFHRWWMPAEIASMIAAYATAPVASDTTPKTMTSATPVILPCVGPLAADLALAARIGALRNEVPQQLSLIERKASSEAWTRALRAVAKQHEENAAKKDREQVLVQPMFEPWE